MTYKEFFKGKKVAVVGLGLHMEMVPDIKFLLKMGTKLEQSSGMMPTVAVYDIRSEDLLKHALADLIEAGLKKYVVGQLEGRMGTDGSIANELAAADIIILSPDVPMDASFLAKARAAKVPIEFPQILLLKLAPPITLIGVMGACGKSTVAWMTYSILKKAFSDDDDAARARVYHIDPDAPAQSVF